MSKPDIDVIVPDLVVLAQAAAAKLSGTGSKCLQITVFADGTGLISCPDKCFGGYMTPLVEAFDEFEAWLAQDEVAEVNATLGIEL